MFVLEEQRSRRLSRHRTARYRPKSRCPETAGGVRRHGRCAGQPLRPPAHTRRGRPGDGCESGQSDGADTIVNHGRPPRRLTHRHLSLNPGKLPLFFFLVVSCHQQPIVLPLLLGFCLQKISIDRVYAVIPRHSLALSPACR
jgi:hypothetical protein